MNEIRAKRTRERRICQGDILGDVEHIDSVKRAGDFIEISKTIFPRVVVLSQDCDLEQYFRSLLPEGSNANHDKHLVSVLVAPLYNAEHVFIGEHLSDLGLKMQIINKAKTPGKSLMNNETPRYHYLEFPKDVQLPPLVIDFKHYFSVNVEYLKKIKPKKFICQVGELFREDISQRFAAFLCRIGLPDPPKPKQVPNQFPASSPAAASTTA